jgi:hypothetical protein
MSNDPTAQQNAEADKLNKADRERAIENAVATVKTAIKHFTDDDRKRVLDLSLEELKSKLGVIQG